MKTQMENDNRQQTTDKMTQTQMERLASFSDPQTRGGACQDPPNSWMRYTRFPTYFIFYVVTRNVPPSTRDRAPRPPPPLPSPGSNVCVCIHSTHRPLSFHSVVGPSDISHPGKANPTPPLNATFEFVSGLFLYIQKHSMCV